MKADTNCTSKPCMMNKKLLKLQKKGAKNIYKKDLKKWYKIIDVLLNPKIIRLIQTEH